MVKNTFLTVYSISLWAVIAWFLKKKQKNSLSQFDWVTNCKTINLNPMLPPCGETFCTKGTGRKKTIYDSFIFCLYCWCLLWLFYNNRESKCWWVFVPPGEWKRGQRGWEGLKAVSQPVSIQRLVQHLPRDPANKHPARGTSQEMSLHVTKI